LLIKYKITEVNHINLHKSHSNNNTILYCTSIEPGIVCHCIIYGYAPMIRSFLYHAFVSCIVRSFCVSCVRSFPFSV